MTAVRTVVASSPKSAQPAQSISRVPVGVSLRVDRAEEMLVGSLEAVATSILAGEGDAVDVVQLRHADLLRVQDSCSRVRSSQLIVGTPTRYGNGLADARGPDASQAANPLRFRRSNSS